MCTHAVRMWSVCATAQLLKSTLAGAPDSGLRLCASCPGDVDQVLATSWEACGPSFVSLAHRSFACPATLWHQAEYHPRRVPDGEH